MKNEKLVRRVVVAAVTGVMVLSLGSLVFANGNGDANTAGENAAGGFFRKGLKAFRSGLGTYRQELIQNGVISEDQANKIDSFIKGKEDAKRAEMTKQAELRLEEQLKKQVDSGVLKQEQVAKILDFMKKKEEERIAEADKLRNMTKEERDAYLSQKLKEKKDISSEMVAAGIITQEQATSLGKLLQHGPLGGFGGGPGRGRGMTPGKGFGKGMAPGTGTANQTK